MSHDKKDPADIVLHLTGAEAHYVQKAVIFAEVSAPDGLATAEEVALVDSILEKILVAARRVSPLNSRNPQPCPACENYTCQDPYCWKEHK